MKKLFLLTIFILLASCNYAYAQTEIEIANQRLDKTLSILEGREKEIRDLKAVIEQLKASQQTPCSIAQKSATETLIYWHTEFTKATNGQDKKEIAKTLKLARKQQKANCRGTMWNQTN